jgi:hypothetical protein
LNAVDETRARQLFEQYDGSLFFMSRDGADVEYRRLAVPRATEAAWLVDLTARKIASLGEPGSFRVIAFLMHHADFSHVSAVVAADPKGNGSDQLNYLREALAYVAEAVRRGVVDRGVLDQMSAIVTDRSLAVATHWPAARDHAEALIQTAVRASAGDSAAT